MATRRPVKDMYGALIQPGDIVAVAVTGPGMRVGRFMYRRIDGKLRIKAMPATEPSGDSRSTEPVFTAVMDSSCKLLNLSAGKWCERVAVMEMEEETEIEKETPQNKIE